MAKMQIKISTNQIGTAIDYYAQGEWRCLKLYQGELDQAKVRREWSETAQRHNIPFTEVTD